MGSMGSNRNAALVLGLGRYRGAFVGAWSDRDITKFVADGRTLPKLRFTAKASIDRRQPVRAADVAGEQHHR